jgi:hypothetical protein
MLPVADMLLCMLLRACVGVCCPLPPFWCAGFFVSGGGGWSVLCHVPVVCGLLHALAVGHGSFCAWLLVAWNFGVCDGGGVSFRVLFFRGVGGVLTRGRAAAHVVVRVDGRKTVL